MRLVSKEMSRGALVSAVRMIAQADRAFLTTGTAQTAWLGYNIGNDIISRLVKRRGKVVPATLPETSPVYFVLEDAADGVTYMIRWISHERFEQMVKGCDYIDPSRGYFPVVQLILDVITSGYARDHVVASTRTDLLLLARTLLNQSYVEAKDSAQKLVDAVVRICSLDSQYTAFEMEANMPAAPEELAAALTLQADCFDARGDSGAAWLVRERIALLPTA
jgi:hypothetical protein